MIRDEGSHADAEQAVRVLFNKACSSFYMNCFSELSKDTSGFPWKAFCPVE